MICALSGPPKAKRTYSISNEKRALDVEVETKRSLFCMIWKKMFYILIQILSKCVLNGSMDNLLLVQVMAWHRTSYDDLNYHWCLYPSAVPTRKYIHTEPRLENQEEKCHLHRKCYIRHMLQRVETTSKEHGSTKYFVWKLITERKNTILEEKI